MTAKHKYEWSEDGQIFFCDGYGYGLNEQLQSMSLGIEEEILKAYETGAINLDLRVSQRMILKPIIDRAIEERNGEQHTNRANNRKKQVKRTSVGRGRSTKSFQHREVSNRRITARKRIPVYST